MPYQHMLVSNDLSRPALGALLRSKTTAASRSPAASIVLPDKAGHGNARRRSDGTIGTDGRPLLADRLLTGSKQSTGAGGEDAIQPLPEFGELVPVEKEGHRRAVGVLAHEGFSLVIFLVVE